VPGTIRENQMSERSSAAGDSGVIYWFEKSLDAIAALCRLITGVSMVFLTVIFGWLVFGRYVLNATPTWVEQAALLLVMTIAFLAAAVGIHENTHLSVNIFRNLSHPRLRRAMVVLSDLLLLGFGALMCWHGAQLTLFKWSTNIPLIQLPEGLRSLPLTIGGGLIVLFTIGHLLRLARGQDKRDEALF
jgi:TRAP-type C4-dicarboxylate transport system permease small subunit